MTAVATKASTTVASGRLAELERVIERGLATFVEVGSALMEVRDSRLYRGDFDTFEEYCRDRWGMSRPRAYELIGAAKVVVNLSATADTQPLTERQIRSLTRLEAEQQREAWQEAVETAPDGKVTAAHVENVVREIEGKRPHVANNSGNNEWYTPAPFIEAARRAMGSIDTDPASSAVANRTVKAARYFDLRADGLTQKWQGAVWLNPPYSQPAIADFCAAAVEKFLNGEIVQACVLVNNATETTWFQSLRAGASAVCLLRGRIRYENATGTPANSPLQGQAVVYFGNRRDEFAEAFAGLGWVLNG